MKLATIFIAVFWLLSSQYSLALTRELKVGAWNNFPVIFNDSDGNVKGFYVDLLEEIGKNEDIRFEFVVDTWDACLDKIRTGEIDLLPGVAYLEERAIYADYTQRPILTVWGELYALKASNINGVLDISGKKIGVVKSDILTKNFSELIEKFGIACELVEFGVYDDVFNAVVNQEVAAGIAEVPYGMLMQEEYGLKSTGVAFSPSKYFFISPKGKNDDIIKMLDGYLQEWQHQDNSFLEKSKIKWLTNLGGTVARMPKWLMNALITLAVLVLVALFFIVLLRKRVDLATKEIRKGETKLRDSNKYLQSVLNSFHDAVFVHDGDTYKVLDVNDSSCQIFGYTREELLQTSIGALSKGAPPYSEVDAFEWFMKARDGEAQIFEWMAKHKEGYLFWLEVSIRYVVIGERKRFVVVGHHIGARKKAELELIKSKEKAEESDRLKTAFLQNLSHEIRTPMNAIMGFSELMVENYGNKTNLEKFGNIIIRRCKDLLDVINDILDISKIESGQVTINKEECNIIEMFDELHVFFEGQQKRLKKQHIEFRIQYNGNEMDASVVTDKIKLKQILINLIGNAFKFTEDGSVSCTCSRENNSLIFRVSDTGIGIPVHEYGRIFERFSQLEHETIRNVGGTGLGLPIAQGLIKLLGGKISVESVTNKGTTFQFSIHLE